MMARVAKEFAERFNKVNHGRASEDQVLRAMPTAYDLETTFSGDTSEPISLTVPINLI